MPAGTPPRWITVRKPFDYRWPDRSAITSFREADLGEHYVKAEVADFAVGGGYATEGKLDGSEAKAPKSRRRRRTSPKTTRAKAAKPADDAAASDQRADTAVDGAHLADHDRASAGPAVDHDAEQR